MIANEIGRYYEFGPFRVDAQKRVLLRAGEAVALTPKAFEVLLVLIRGREMVVEKDRLLQDVWPDTVVDENNLARNISALRKALGEAPNQHRYVVTIPGRGYRFVADVQESSDEGSEPPPPVVREDVQPAAPVPSDARRRATAGGLLVIGITLVAYLISWSAHSSQERPLPRRLWQLTFDPGLEGEPTWSKDGHLLAYSSDRAGNFDIWVQPVGEGNAVQVTTSPDHDWQPDWSPDGARVVFRSEREGGGLFVVPALGGEERRIASFGFRPRWSPDGAQILFYSAFGHHASELPKIYVLTPGGTPREVLGRFVTQFAWVRVGWHPDGRRVSLWGQHRRDGWSFWTVSLDGDEPVKSEVSKAVADHLALIGVRFVDFAWARSGDALYLEGTAHDVKNLWKIAVDARTLRWVGGPERLTTGAGIETDLGLSGDGTKLAFTVRTERTRLWSMPFDAARGTVGPASGPVTSAGLDALMPDLAPDGKRLAFLARRGNREELWARTLERGPETLLQPTGDFERAAPRWSRDGALLAYRRTRVLNADRTRLEHALVVMPAAGGDEQPLTSPGAVSVNALDWSPDGEWILGNSDWKSPGRLAIVRFPRAAAPVAETAAELLTSHPEYNLWQARYSPDGRWISFMAVDVTDSATSTLYVVPASGGSWTRLTDGRAWDDKVRWSPDGRTLYFVSDRAAGFFNVWGLRFDPVHGRPVGEPFRVTSFESPGPILVPYATTMEMTLAADRLVLPIMEASGGIWILEHVGR